MCFYISVLLNPVCRSQNIEFIMYNFTFIKLNYIHNIMDICSSTYANCMHAIMYIDGCRWMQMGAQGYNCV